MQTLIQFSGPDLANLFHGMLGDADPRIRRTAVEGLNQTEGSTASDALRTAALDQDPEVRYKHAIDGAFANRD
jgi:HEAT repeat protein